MVAGGTGELDHMSCVLATPDPEASRKAVVYKEEAITGGACFGEGVQDSSLTTDEAGGPALAGVSVEVTKRELAESMLQRARNRTGSGAASDGHEGPPLKGGGGAVVRA